MKNVTRTQLKALMTCDRPMFTRQPLQLGFNGDPWKVAVVSMLLCRARWSQASRVAAELLTLWPTPEALCAAEPAELEEVVRPCGLHRNRTRQLQRFSCLWLTASWEDFKELPGVGLYVSDAVGLFCLGRTDLESNDPALVERVRCLEMRSEKLLQESA